MLHPVHQCFLLTVPRRPEQLILQDDPSFLPDFALPPPEFLADLDFSINRSSESQSLTPFGSQVSSQDGPLGGLVLPSSSPGQPPGSFHLGGDNDIAGPSAVDESFHLADPEFTFGDDGELIEGNVAGTPAARSAAAIQSDAGASAKVRKEHEEGRAGAVQVSFTAVLRAIFSLASLACL